jgi:LemA protein
MRARSLAFAAIALLAFPGCGYRALQGQDEDLKAAWVEVLNQYQRRAELIPNLLRMVKAYPNPELQGPLDVTEACAKQAGAIQVSPDLVNNPEVFAKFQASQGQLSAALKNLFAVSEAHPQLQSDADFQDLHVALERIENRIAVARNGYIDAARNYNVTVSSFPTNLTARMFDFQVKPNFTVADEQTISTAPWLDFGDAPAKHLSTAPAHSRPGTPEPSATTSSPPVTE